MSASRQARRQLGRSLKALGKAPLEASEISPFNSELGAVAEDVRLAAGRCAACLSTSGERKSCHACGFVRYCNRECQTAGWPSHKLICRVLAADREIVSAAKLTESTPLLPLDTIWERLRSGGHAEAFEATSHLLVWTCRSDRDLPSRSVSTAGPEHISAFSDEIAASDGIALLVKGLEAGGLRAVAVLGVLDPLVSRCPEVGASLVAAGSLLPLIYAISLPSKHADFGKVWSILRAADDSALLVGLLGASSARLPRAPAIVEAGAVPVLVEYLTFVMRDEPQLETHRRFRDLGIARVRAISAVAHLFAREDTGEAFKASTARAFITSGAFPPLLAALGGEGRTAGCASLCLGYIVRHSGDRALAATLGKDHAPEIVAVLAGENNAKHGAFLLYIILRLAPEIRATVVAAGALRPLVALLSANSKDGIAEMSAASSLGSLCSGDPVQVEAAFAEGALEPLLARMKHLSVSTRQNAAWALSGMLLSSAKREHKDRALAGGAVRMFAERLAEAASTGDSRLANSASSALTTFFVPPAEDGSAPPLHASIVDQILEAVPPSRLVKMIESEYVSLNTLCLLDGIAASPDRHGALVGAKLPRALASALATTKEAAAASRGLGLQHVPKVVALGLLSSLLRGPEAANAADAFLAADGFLALANALGEGEKVATSAAACLLAVSELDERRRAALVAAGAVPRLLTFLSTDESAEGPGSAKQAAACTLLNLMKESASVAAEAAAAGFDTSRLRLLASLPDEPAAPSSA